MQGPTAAITVPDGIVLAVCLVLGIRGATKGFVWQAVRTAGLIGALWGATRFHVPFGERLDAWFGFIPTFATPVVAWLVILVVIFVLFAFFAHLARGAVRTGGLTGLDRVFGFLLGAIMGLAFCAIGFVIWGHLIVGETELRQTLAGSTSARYMAQTIEFVEPLFPEDVRERFGKSLGALDEAGS